MKPIPIFIINLARNSFRKKRMQEIMTEYGLSAEFIPAVDGSTLDEKTIESVYKKEKAIKKINRGLSKGEIGCAMSHQYIYQKMLDESIKQAIIFEDDIILNDHFSKLPGLISSLPRGWDILFLGHTYHKNKHRRLLKVKTIADFTINFAINTVDCAHAYLINQKAARYLLHITNPLDKPIDSYTGDYTHLKGYCLLPEMVTLDFTLESNLEPERALLSGGTIFVESKKMDETKKVLRFFRLFDLLKKIKIVTGYTFQSGLYQINRKVKSIISRAF